jgi:putative membrane protein
MSKGKTMKNYRLIALGFAAGLALTAANAGAQTMNAPAGTLAKADQTFLNDAIEGDLAEINVGKLAQEKGQSQEVKQFGQMLEQDHSQHLQKAKQTAPQMGFTPPTEPNAKQKKTYEQLSKQSGAQFDRQFAQDMVTDHKQTISKFEKEAKSNGPFADFARQTIPTLQKHLQTAESLTGQKHSQR